MKKALLIFNMLSLFVVLSCTRNVQHNHKANKDNVIIDYANTFTNDELLDLIATNQASKFINHLKSLSNNDRYNITCDGEFLWSAAMFGRLEIVKYLCEQCHVNVNAIVGGSYGSTALMAAADGGYLDIIKYLHENHNADINGRDNNTGETALIHAITHAKSTIFDYYAEEAKNDKKLHSKLQQMSIRKTTFEDRIKLIKYLCEHGADVNMKFDDDATALDTACAFELFEIIQYLIEQCGSKINKNAIKQIKNDKIKKYLLQKTH